MQSPKYHLRPSRNARFRKRAERPLNKIAAGSAMSQRMRTHHHALPVRKWRMACSLGAATDTGISSFNGGADFDATSELTDGTVGDEGTSLPTIGLARQNKRARVAIHVRVVTRRHHAILKPSLSPICAKSKTWEPQEAGTRYPRVPKPAV